MPYWEKSLSNSIYLLLEMKSIKMIYLRMSFGIYPFLYLQEDKSLFFQRGKL